MTDVFVAEDQSLAVVVTQAILESLARHCSNAGKNETGGILIGHYTALRDQAVITRVTGAPPDSKAGPTWFVRGIAGLQQLIDAAWRRRDYYIGEWHFHPFAAPEPSERDRRQIVEFAREPNYRCPEPILVIVGGDPKIGGDLAVAVAIKGRVERLVAWKPASADRHAVRTDGRQRRKGARRQRDRNR